MILIQSSTLHSYVSLSHSNRTKERKETVFVPLLILLRTDHNSHITHQTGEPNPLFFSNLPINEISCNTWNRRKVGTEKGGK